MTQKPLFTGSEWTFDLIQQSLEIVESIGRKELGMNLYPNQIEIISSEQMLDSYSSVGMPVMYNHWSYGKQLIRDQQQYKKGHMGLAYEIIINSNPAIAYLMEENTMTMQLLTIAHASVGHNYCFANNYMFKQWTDADSIIDYLVFAKKYVTKCEEKYGVDEVEKILDSLHALQSFGVDKYRRPPKLNAKKEQEKLANRLQDWEKSQNEMWYHLDKKSRKKPEKENKFDEPEENILYFIEKNSPILKPWQREIVRIVRKVSQYFYPQKFTKVVNEASATFTHHWILNNMYDNGMITDGSMMEWLSSHANVIYQPSFDSKYYSGINPYAIGFAVLKDIQRMATQPTEEDKTWFPKLANADWKSVVREAITEYRDDSFIAQWLSPKVARDLKLFGIVDDKNEKSILVNAIHNEQTFYDLRKQLSEQYDVNSREPNIMAVGADLGGDRTLYLQHNMNQNRMLDKNTQVVLAHVKRLWGFPVSLKTVDENNKVIITY